MAVFGIFPELCSHCCYLTGALRQEKAFWAATTMLPKGEGSRLVDQLLHGHELLGL